MRVTINNHNIFVMGNKSSSTIVVNGRNDFNSCQHIKRYLDSDGWCKKCMLNNNKWTSGNFHIDKFVRKTQKKSCKWTDNFLEWIPFENFQNLKKIGCGYFSTVYCATWLDGKRIKSTNKTVCARSGPTTVVLKSIKNSGNLSSKYVQELEKYYKCTLVKSKKRSSHFLEIYGITFNVKTDEYMLVTQYVEFGNLRNFIKENKFNNISWSQKLWWLCDIASTLATIHKEGLVHGNLHPGNVLQMGEDIRDTHSVIVDIGISSPAYNDDYLKKEDFYGVLPYIAPEVLKGNKYTKESDLYSLGILMMELATGEPPFCKRSHDQALIKEICENHKRPNFLENTPKKFKELALHCTDPNPSARLSAKLLSYIFSNWWQIVEQSQDYEIGRQFNSSNEFIKNMDNVKLKHDPNAIYTSKHFSLDSGQNILIINDDGDAFNEEYKNNNDGSKNGSTSNSHYDSFDENSDNYDYLPPHYSNSCSSSIDKNNERFHADNNNNFKSKYLFDLNASPKF